MREILVATYAYAWNIYFNFSGYTNLVTGIALLLGFRVPVNFNAPYLAANLKSFGPVGTSAYLHLFATIFISP